MVSKTADLYFPQHRPDVFQAVGAAIPREVNDLYFPSHKKQVIDAVEKEISSFFNAVVSIIVDYVTKTDDDVFGSEYWMKYFGVEVREKKIDKRFYSIWFGPDPVDPMKKVYETHLPPVFRPQLLKFTQKKTVAFCTLNIFKDLGLVFKKSLVQNEDGTFKEAEAVLQFGNNQVTDACWLLFRKEVIGKNQTSEAQAELIQQINKASNVSYEVFPSLVDLCCVIFTRYKTTGQRYLGDATGMEKEITYSQCKEMQEEPEAGMSFSFIYPTLKNRCTIGGLSNEGVSFVGGNSSVYAGVSLVMKL